MPLALIFLDLPHRRLIKVGDIVEKKYTGTTIQYMYNLSNPTCTGEKFEIDRVSDYTVKMVK